MFLANETRKWLKSLDFPVFIANKSPSKRADQITDYDWAKHFSVALDSNGEPTAKSYRICAHMRLELALGGE